MKPGFPEKLEWRKDPTTGLWVIIAPWRSKRPYDFDIHSGEGKTYPCAFCMGMEEHTPHEVFRLVGDDNREQWLVRVFPNKFPALRRGEEFFVQGGDGLHEKMGGFGVHEVIVETPEHYADFSQFSQYRMEKVLYVYRERIARWEKDSRLRYCLIFKNQGIHAGASMFHPHSQLIATPLIPKRVEEELIQAQHFYENQKKCLFCALIEAEMNQRVRLVYHNDHFVAFIPHAARFPYEIWLLPVLHHASFLGMEYFSSCAQALRIILQALRKALGELTFNFVLHGAPYERNPEDRKYASIYHWHLEIIPFSTRMAGFEWGTGFHINPTSPEKVACSLREIIRSGVGEEFAGD